MTNVRQPVTFEVGGGADGNLALTGTGDVNVSGFVATRAGAWPGGPLPARRTTSGTDTRPAAMRNSHAPAARPAKRK